MLDLSVQIGALAAALSVMGIAWVVSISTRDASIADIAWGLAFVAIAWISMGIGDGDGGRSLIVTVLVTLWGLRLAAFIAERHDGEDSRYAAMREKYGDSAFAKRSLWSVFGLQGVLAFVISLPVQVVATDPTPEAMGIVAWLGFALFTFGLFFEAVSDNQLRAFMKDEDNKGEVMDKGLWRYSRHPDYFGEVCVWWGIWLFALETGSGWWTFIGPLAITVLILRVSGVALTEKTITSRRPGYADYVERTSAFIPRPPKR